METSPSIWESGDTALVYPCEAAFVFSSSGNFSPRQYTIASLPQEGSLDLIVRQRKTNGVIGLCSSWLTDPSTIEKQVALSIRKNSNVRALNLSAPGILIGAGSGLAGIRSQVKARSNLNSRAWVIYGERDPESDNMLSDELQSWLANSEISRCQIAFSKSSSQPRYVQHIMDSHAKEIRQWIDGGASIYVCGNHNLMGRSVHKALADILGKERRDSLIEESRYVRDTY